MFSPQLQKSKLVEMLQKKMMEKLSLAAFCLTFVCAESFVKEKNPNNDSIKEFTIDLEESGTNLTQTVKLDKENGLVITDVPAHNDIDPSTSYHDEKLVSNIIFIDVLPR